MKTKVVLALALTVFGSGLVLAEEKMSDMKDLNAKADKGQVHSASGVVKKVDSATGQVTLEHGPVKSLNWPAMTMTFDVRDKALLRDLKIGKKVEFKFVQEGSKYVVTGIR